MSLASVVAVGGAVLTVFNGIGNLVKVTLNSITNVFVKKIFIKTKDNANFATNYAFKMELSDGNNAINASDDGDDIKFEIGNGIYVKSPKYYGSEKNILIWIDDDCITLYCLFCFDNRLRYYVSDIYKKFNSPDDRTIKYSSNGNSWGFPKYQRLRDVNLMISNLHSSSLAVLNDVAQFFDSEQEFARKAKPFRFGYILSGPTGSGKTALAEIIAMKFKMTMYSVVLNSDKMNDATLIDLVTSVPPRSLILFDEFEKQLEAIQSNKNINISEAGILTAIDGPQRLSHGSIVLLTVNEMNSLRELFRIALNREGRIDKHFEVIK